MFVRRVLLFALTIAVAGGLVLSAAGQNIVSGDVTGVVTDPTGAVLPNVVVTLKNVGTGQTQTSSTNTAGVYRFSLLNPGTYTVNAAGQGCQATARQGTVAGRQASTVNLQLALSGANTTVEVTGEAGVVQSQNAN